VCDITKNYGVQIVKDCVPTDDISIAEHTIKFRNSSDIVIIEGIMGNIVEVRICNSDSMLSIVLGGVLLMRNGGTFNPRSSSFFRRFAECSHPFAIALKVGIIRGCFRIQGKYIRRNMGNLIWAGKIGLIATVIL